ncbi:MAG: amidase [Lysobacteraceae bacterium]
MRHRYFIRPLAIIAACGLGACASQPTSQQPNDPPAAAKSLASNDTARLLDDLDSADIASLQAAMQRGDITAEELTQRYLDRIAAIDDAGPMLNAVIEINPNAAAEARARDQARADGRESSPLHGIPVLLKDNIDATPMVNSAGSLALAEHRPAEDAPLVKALRNAGAVIIGKANLSEWANIRSDRSTSGWSARGGQTRNPYVLDRNTCGSSSGTGAGIAASLATVGVGTETDGSVICPSSVNGLVGIKPTVGLVSRSGIIPISHTQDTAGPMARTVADAATLLGGMVGAVDENDPSTIEGAKHARRDYRVALDAGALNGARIGVLRDSMGFHPDVDAALEEAIRAMQAAGATVVDAKIPTAGKWGEAEFTVLLYELKHDLAAYFEASAAPMKTLADVIAFNRANADAEMPWFGQELFEAAEARGPLSDEEYRTAVEKSRRLAGPEGIDAALAEHRLDALLAPATSPAWTIDPVNGDHFLGAGYGAAAVAGYPSITVPMGDAHGLPFGLVFLGPAWSESRLIGYAYAYEQLSHKRRPPRFLPTLPISGDNAPLTE